MKDTVFGIVSYILEMEIVLIFFSIVFKCMKIKVLKKAYDTTKSLEITFNRKLRKVT